MVCVNEELTAEEWKRRFEKGRDRCVRLKGHLARTETELDKWRLGESISPEEQVRIDANMLLDGETGDGTVSAGATPLLSVKADEWERERAILYEQLDEKVRINLQVTYCLK